MKIRNTLENTDIKGAQVNWQRRHVKEYNPMDYSDVSKVISERRLRAPNAHQDLKPEQLMPHQLLAKYPGQSSQELQKYKNLYQIRTEQVFQEKQARKQLVQLPAEAYAYQ